MPTLQDKLDEMRAALAAQAPKPALDVMQRAAESLLATGQHERALAEGAKAPGFELENQEGVPVSSEQLLDEGPLVLTFFRGHW